MPEYVPSTHFAASLIIASPHSGLGGVATRTDASAAFNSAKPHSVEEFVWRRQCDDATAWLDVSLGGGYTPIYPTNVGLASQDGDLSHMGGALELPLDRRVFFARDAHAVRAAVTAIAEFVCRRHTGSTTLILYVTGFCAPTRDRSVHYLCGSLLEPPYVASHTTQPATVSMDAIAAALMQLFAPAATEGTQSGGGGLNVVLVCDACVHPDGPTAPASTGPSSPRSRVAAPAAVPLLSVVTFHCFNLELILADVARRGAARAARQPASPPQLPLDPTDSPVRRPPTDALGKDGGPSGVAALDNRAPAAAARAHLAPPSAVLDVPVDIGNGVTLGAAAVRAFLQLAQREIHVVRRLPHLLTPLGPSAATAAGSRDRAATVGAWLHATGELLSTMTTDRFTAGPIFADVTAGHDTADGAAALSGSAGWAAAPLLPEFAAFSQGSRFLVPTAPGQQHLLTAEIPFVIDIATGNLPTGAVVEVAASQLLGVFQNFLDTTGRAAVCGRRPISFALRAEAETLDEPRDAVRRNVRLWLGPTLLQHCTVSLSTPPRGTADPSYELGETTLVTVATPSAAVLQAVAAKFAGAAGESLLRFAQYDTVGRWLSCQCAAVTRHGWQAIIDGCDAARASGAQSLGALPWAASLTRPSMQLLIDSAAIHRHRMHFALAGATMYEAPRVSLDAPHPLDLWMDGLRSVCARAGGEANPAAAAAAVAGVGSGFPQWVRAAAAVLRRLEEMQPAVPLSPKAAVATLQRVGRAFRQRRVLAQNGTLSGWLASCGRQLFEETGAAPLISAAAAVTALVDAVIWAAAPLRMNSIIIRAHLPHAAGSGFTLWQTSLSTADQVLTDAIGCIFTVATLFASRAAVHAVVDCCMPVRQGALGPRVTHVWSGALTAVIAASLANARDGLVWVPWVSLAIATFVASFEHFVLRPSGRGDDGTVKISFTLGWVVCLFLLHRGSFNSVSRADDVPYSVASCVDFVVILLGLARATGALAALRRHRFDMTQRCVVSSMRDSVIERPRRSGRVARYLVGRNSASPSVVSGDVEMRQLLMAAGDGGVSDFGAAVFSPAVIAPNPPTRIPASPTSPTAFVVDMRRPSSPQAAPHDAGLVVDDGASRRGNGGSSPQADDQHRGTAAASGTNDRHTTPESTPGGQRRQMPPRSHHHRSHQTSHARTSTARGPKHLIFVPLMAAVVVIGLIGVVRFASVEWTCGPVSAKCLDMATNTHATLRIPEAHATALDGCALYSDVSKASIFSVCVDVLAAANAKAGLGAVSPATVGLRFDGTFGLEQCLDVDGAGLMSSDASLWLPQFRCAL